MASTEIPPEYWCQAAKEMVFWSMEMLCAKRSVEKTGLMMYWAVLWRVVRTVLITVFTHLLLFQPSIKSFGTERLIRTSLDLELDLQASKTWHDRLVQEISVLRELKEQLEQAQSQGEKELPQWVKDDERFRLLLRLVEKRVSNTCPWILFKMFEKRGFRNRRLWTVRK